MLLIDVLPSHCVCRVSICIPLLSWEVFCLPPVWMPGGNVGTVCCQRYMFAMLLKGCQFAIYLSSMWHSLASFLLWFSSIDLAKIYWGEQRERGVQVISVYLYLGRLWASLPFYLFLDCRAASCRHHFENSVYLLVILKRHHLHMGCSYLWYRSSWVLRSFTHHFLASLLGDPLKHPLSISNRWLCFSRSRCMHANIAILQHVNSEFWSRCSQPHWQLYIELYRAKQYLFEPIILKFTSRCYISVKELRWPIQNK